MVVKFDMKGTVHQVMPLLQSPLPLTATTGLETWIFLRLLVPDPR